MDEKVIAVQVISTVAEVLKKQVTNIAGTETYQELGVDVLDMFEIVLKLEDAFMVEISDEECEQLTSIPATIHYICSKKISINQIT